MQPQVLMQPKTVPSISVVPGSRKGGSRSRSSSCCRDLTTATWYLLAKELGVLCQAKAAAAEAKAKAQELEEALVTDLRWYFGFEVSNQK